MAHAMLDRVRADYDENEKQPYENYEYEEYNNQHYKSSDAVDYNHEYFECDYSDVNDYGSSVNEK